jgi:rabenosyn-5
MLTMYSYRLTAHESSNDDQPTKEASAARKRLLDAFAQYDALAKRIRAIPCVTGSSQDRVQLAVLTRANLFLQKHMFPLQVNSLMPAEMFVN